MNRPQRIKNHRQEASAFKARVIKAAIVIVILVCILLARLFYLQVIQYQLYQNLAQHNQLELLPIEPNRGLIYDRHGILIAENLPVFSLKIIPEYLNSIETTLTTLQSIIKIDDDNIRQFNKALQQRHRFEHIPLKFKLTQEEVAAIYLNQYRLQGVVVEADLIRHYPLGESMVSALGYVGRINQQDLKVLDTTNYAASSFIGKVGIEKFYENELHGKVGYKINKVDAAGHIVATLKKIPPIPGNNIYLTIDSKLQQIAHDALGGERGAVVVIDPNNGEVLALVSHPGYNPNLFTNGIDVDSFKDLQNSPDKPMYNRAIRALYPFASNIKPFIALQGLDTETITAELKISDPGWYKLPNSEHIYRDWMHNGHGMVDVTKAIITSCDTFFYTLAFKLGIEKIDDILTRFGFGNKTGIDLGEEVPGVLASPKWVMKHIGRHWYLGDTIISGIGQGYMLTTPLQLANGVAAIAKHGIRFQPHTILLIQRQNGHIDKIQPLLLPPVILNNSNNWDIIINAMQKVISDPTGTGHSRFGVHPVPAYTIAAKTGTAQLFHHKIVNENPTPESEENVTKLLRNHHLFIAFAPIANPQIAIAVVSENSMIAPEVARKVLDYYLTGTIYK